MPVQVHERDQYGHLTQQGRSRAGLERVDEDVEEHQAGGDEFGAGAEEEAQEGAEGRFDAI